MTKIEKKNQFPFENHKRKFSLQQVRGSECEPQAITHITIVMKTAMSIFLLYILKNNNTVLWMDSFFVQQS